MSLLVSLKDKVARTFNEPDLANAFRQIENWSVNLLTSTLGANLTGIAGRYVGQTNGAPTTGTYRAGDFANDPTNGVIWLCTISGTPGTWRRLPLAATTFTALTYTVGFSNNPGNAPGGYFLDSAGFAHLRGAIQYTGTLPAGFTTMVTALPASVRPVVTAIGGIPLNQSGGLTPGLLQVSTAGAVSIYTTNALTNPVFYFNDFTYSTLG